MVEKYRFVHYLNQYFAQIGGEEKAGVNVTAIEGPVGPGLVVESILGNRGGVVATVICGDDYFNENIDAALERILQIVPKYEPDAFIAGPAFSAGRYGLACGAICEAIQIKLKIPVVTAMFEENSAVEMYRRSVFIIRGGKNARSTYQDLSNTVGFALKLLNGEEIGNPTVGGYFPKGIIRNAWCGKPAIDRAIDILIRKIKGESFETELSRPKYPRVRPAKKVENIKESIIALATDGGLVPKGNPDNMESVQTKKYGLYSFKNESSLSPNDFEVCHGGYDTKYISQDPNRIVPVDVLRDFENEGKIYQLYGCFFSTSGVGVAIDHARKMGEEISNQIKKAEISGVILTST